MNQLESLKRFSTIVADSGDIEAIRCYHPQNATTNPSLILKATKLDFYHSLIEDSIIYAKKNGGSHQNKIINAVDKLTINIGSKILEIIPGHISTEIDSKFSFNKDATIEKSHKLINMYQEQGINKSRILIKIAATWEGIKAAQELKKNEIKCNLTLIFSFAQARACAESKIYLISPFVGRIYDWYNQKNLLQKNNIQLDPGVKSVKKIFYYYKKHHYNTIIMAASFRTIEQILALSGCDCLTIAPNFLKKLSNSKEPINNSSLSFEKNQNKTIKQPNPLCKSEFLWEHNQNPMAVEKLAEGIRQFAIDQTKLANLLSKRIF